MSPRPADAVALAEAAHERIPRRTDASLVLFRLYQQNGREADAEKLAALDPLLRRKVPSAHGGAAGGPIVMPGDSMGTYESATELIARGEYEKALDQLQKVRQEADNPSVAGALDAKIAELKKTIAHNQFVAKFNAAAEHFNHQRWDETIETLEALLLNLGDEEHKKKAGDLLSQAQRRKAEYAKVATHNQFVAVLNEATALYNAKKPKEAADLVERQLAVLTDPADLELARKFIDHCRKTTLRGGG